MTSHLKHESSHKLCLLALSCGRYFNVVISALKIIFSKSNICFIIESLRNIEKEKQEKKFNNPTT